MRYDAGVQLRLPGVSPTVRGRAPAARRDVRVGEEMVPLAIVRHHRARRYVLRVGDDGSLRLTVPRGASIAGGLRFAQRQADWIVRERLRQDRRCAPWAPGTRIWFRGDTVTLGICGGRVTLDGVCLTRMPAKPELSLRELVERQLRVAAEVELSARCRELAEAYDRPIARVYVRNQRSRWGACSGRGVITLNWRLIQMPPSVSDYIICHELAHLRHPNHSVRFWREVERLCPAWREGEQWIRRHGREIL